MIVRLAARDPGGANVVAAFYNRAKLGDAFATSVWCMPKAAAVFERAGIASRVFSDPVAAADLAAAWREQPAQVLITGTSHQAPFESALWQIAREHRCSSLALIDQWCNLALRFTGGRPDFVGAIDDGQRTELVELGFNSDAVIVAGQSWLAELADSADVQPVAAAAPDDHGAVRVLYVSENIADDVAAGRNPAFGFDEFDAFDVVFRAASQAAQAGTRVAIAVKCHPYENLARFRAYLDGLAPVPGVRARCIPDGESPRAWVRWADVVTGVSSMLLFEAMILGRPVVSVQPGLIRENTFAAGVNGYAPTLVDGDAAAAYLRGVIRDPAQRDALLAQHRRFTDGLGRGGADSVLEWVRSRRVA